MTDLPYRLVDADNYSWLATGAGLYRADPHQPDRQEELTLDQVTDQYGPVRPVEPITDDDVARLNGAFDKAGRKSIATLAAAIEMVFHELRESKGGLNSHISYAYAARTLTAGRPGSWESALLLEVMLFGNGLNLVKPKGRAPVGVVAAATWKRAAGPSKRVDVDGRAEMATVLRRWVTGPDRYVEVAETLAAVVSRYADGNSHMRGGDGHPEQANGIHAWKQVADQWLMPGGLAREDIAVCY
ncbi:MAG TPA: hypothetical protein VGL02_05625, partial [Streptomyces sp.]